VRITIKYLLLAALIISSAAAANAQELRCRVSVNPQNIPLVDKSVFTTMQQQIDQFMNNRAWTQDIYGPDERIDCSIVINLEASPTQDVYQARVTVSANRPVYNSTYSTPLINFIDNDWTFTYVQNQPLEFNINSYQNNLTSMLGFYAYMFIGLDAESFAKGGGSKFFTLAETVMTTVPNGGPDAKGWRPFDGVRNRYWMINGLMGGKYEAYKNAMYEYHFLGMDKFYDKPEEARGAILKALEGFERIAKENPNNILLTMFNNAKSQEIIDIFSNSTQAERTRAVNIMRKIDPSNAGKYDKILKG